MLVKVILALIVISATVVADILLVKVCVKSTVEVLKTTEEQNNN